MEVENIVAYMYRKRLECEENIIKEVVRQYTGKELTKENAPKVERFFHANDHSRYILSYNGYKLGMVRYIDEGYTFSVTFTPNEVKKTKNKTK
jgi:hypothetical protein